MLFESCGETEPEEWIQSFHVLREMRNCITHAGGDVSQELRNAVTDMGVDARSGWERLNLGTRPERMEDGGGRLALTAEHIFTAFAVTKRLGRDINALLSREFDGMMWARVAVQDYNSVTSKVKNSSGWRRSLVGYVRQFYSVAPISEADLEAAARELGLWTVAKWK
ncbi:MAG: hypothetical protein ACOYBY_12885 [Dermatophilaceae bacterium]